MTKSKFKLGTLVFAMVFATNLVAPLAMMGQSGGSDGFFKGSSDSYESRDGGIEMSGGITNDSFGAPLGNGLLLMAAAGTIYAVKKRKMLKH